ncbi:MAG: energy-coupling factor transporter ATPase, partial [Corallococcus sp.]|nr:energy-coupling factor transporter ATPase [Corallococcus sp.]
AIISVENATYAYKVYDEEGGSSRAVAVDNVSLQIEEGQFVALVGHNGCGKSTLAKMLNALLLPQSGKVYALGMDTSDGKNVYEIRKNVGMVFQNPDNQMVASIVEEDVAFGPENLAIPRDEMIERVSTALKQVNMSEYAKRTPHKLSGGQKQRIAIAGALAIRPKVLVLDESTAMLDPQGRKEVLAVAHQLNGQGMTVILITHFMEEALDADKIIVMSEGKVVAQGAPMDIFLQRDLIENSKLRIPRTLELAQKLYAAGWEVDPQTVNAAELGGAVCRLLLKD